MSFDLKKLVDLSVTDLLCAVHREPLRLQWPKGLLIVEGRFRNWALSVSKIPDIVKGDKKTIELLLSLKEFCCQITASELISMYNDCKVGVVNECEICHQRSLGTPYRVRTKKKTVKILKHLCFNCLCRKASPEFDLWFEE